MEEEVLYDVPVQLYQAMDEARDNFDPVLKDSKNPHFKSTFASLTSFQAATQPALRAVGISIKYRTFGDSLVLRVVHLPSGEYEDHHGKLYGDNAQQYGGSLTYMRRYLFQVAFDLVAEDDDGNTATGRPAPAEHIARSSAGDAAPQGRSAGAKRRIM